jgi:hypothetical protein
MRHALAVAALLAATACGSDDSTGPADRRVESQIYMALAWDNLDPDQQQLVCDLAPADLEVFLAGLALADGMPPDTGGVAEFLAEIC